MTNGKYNSENLKGIPGCPWIHKINTDKHPNRQPPSANSQLHLGPSKSVFKDISACAKHSEQLGVQKKNATKMDIEYGCQCIDTLRIVHSGWTRNRVLISIKMKSQRMAEALLLINYRVIKP